MREVTIIKQIITENLATNIISLMEPKLTWKDTVNTMRLTQKPVKLLKRLIEIFTDPEDVVIDPCFGSGSTARAAVELGRNFYGFEINKEFYRRAKEEMLKFPEERQLSIFDMDGVSNE